MDVELELIMYTIDYRWPSELLLSKATMSYACPGQLQSVLYYVLRKLHMGIVLSIHLMMFVTCAFYLFAKNLRISCKIFKYAPGTGHCDNVHKFINGISQFMSIIHVFRL